MFSYLVAFEPSLVRFALSSPRLYVSRHGLIKSAHTGRLVLERTVLATRADAHLMYSGVLCHLIKCDAPLAEVARQAAAVYPQPFA
jgi:hypothetical protein